MIRRSGSCFRPPVQPTAILLCAAAYFGVLLGVAWWTGRKADSDDYFRGHRSSPWPVVALGLIGDSLSGVSYISVPGKVAADRFGYLQVVLGYALGYLVIGGLLLPVYYRLGLTSIYSYLGTRFGPAAQKTGAAFFLLSRLTGSAARLLLSIGVFQTFVFGSWNVPFWVTATAVVGLILLYTLRGGIKTLVWTDTLQSGFLVLGVLYCLVALARGLGLDPATLWGLLRTAPETTVFNGDWGSPGNFWKQLVSGAAISVVMTGLDQNNMQKTLSCRSLSDARKNFALFTPVMVAVNLAILTLGFLLFRFAAAHGIPVPARTDQLLPTLALGHLGTAGAVLFVLGLTAATFNSADSVLTTLTTSFCIDFLGLESGPKRTEEENRRIRSRVHVGFALALLAVILVFQALSDGMPLIDFVLKAAGYTYGPLLGLFLAGLLTRIRPSGWPIPVVGVLSMTATACLDRFGPAWFGGYRFGFELLLLNGAMTALGLGIVSRFQTGPGPTAA